MANSIRSQQHHHKNRFRVALVPGPIIIALVVYQLHEHIILNRRILRRGGSDFGDGPKHYVTTSHNDDDTAHNDGGVVSNMLRSRHPQHQPFSTLTPMSQYLNSNAQPSPEYTTMEPRLPPPLL